MLAKTIVLVLAANLKLAVSMPAADMSVPVVDADASELVRRAACALAGVVNGQCGRVYGSGGCGSNLIQQIDPGRCTGTCYNFNSDIWSVKASGDGTYGTNCQIYSGFNCQGSEVIGETGNSVTGGGRCWSGGPGHSVKCWYRC